MGSHLKPGTKIIWHLVPKFTEKNQSKFRILVVFQCWLKTSLHKPVCDSSFLDKCVLLSVLCVLIVHIYVCVSMYANECYE